MPVNRGCIDFRGTARINGDWNNEASDGHWFP